MELERTIVVDAGFELKAGKSPKRPENKNFSVQLPILIDVSNSEMGEDLCLTFRDN